MPNQIDTGRRVRLNRERVLQAAVTLADEIGIDALSMRRLAQELGVVPMALYKHVENKEALLDGEVTANGDGRAQVRLSSGSTLDAMAPEGAAASGKVVTTGAAKTAKTKKTTTSRM